MLHNARRLVFLVSFLVAMTTHALAQSGSIPAAPSNLSASALSSSSIRFLWQDNSYNETGFVVYRWNGSAWQNISTVGSNTTSYTDSGLQPATTYYYTVCATNNTGSACANGYTSAATSAPVLSKITSPADNTVLSGPTVKFIWDNGSGVTKRWLWLGTTKGGADLFDQDMNMLTSATVTQLPVDGKPIYARLWSLINGNWFYRDTYYYGASGGATGDPYDNNGTLSPAPAWAFTEPAPTIVQTQGCCSKNDHDGDDYWAQDWTKSGGGNPVRAPYSGVVVYRSTGASNVTGDCSTQGAQGLPNCWGNQVVVDAGRGIYYRLGHLANDPPVNIGQKIRANQIVGYVGNSGKSTGPHLHMVFYRNITSLELSRLKNGWSVKTITNNNSPTSFAIRWTWLGTAP